MITRAYVVTMPSDEGSESLPVEILIRDDPGTQGAPVSTPGGGSYYEWRGRPVRFETTAADGVNGGFAPRMALGLTLGLTCFNTAVSAMPTVALSASLTPLGTDIGAPYPDPSGEPAIKLQGSGLTSGLVYLLTVQIAQAQDEDQAPRRNG